MLTLQQGDLLRADVDALVNPVNTVGVMGRGLAYQVKNAYPDVYADYVRACNLGVVVTGKIHVTRRSAPPKFVFNFPTKRCWRQPSQLDYIRDGLVDLVCQVRAHGVMSIAIPALGCGCGGLNWCDVKPLIEAAAAELPAIRIALFAPELARS